MSMPSPPLTESQMRDKLLVVRFLNAHLAHGGIEQHSYDMLYRMIMMISSLGRDLHTVSHSIIADVSLVRKMEWYARCVLEGCEVFRKQFEKRLRDAQSAAAQLPDIVGVEREVLGGNLHSWRSGLRTVYLPTANDARLFRHMANHFDDAVYRDFLHFHRRRPENATWCLNEQLTAIQQAIERVHGLCIAGDNIVQRLDRRHDHASRRLDRWLRTQIDPIIMMQPIDFESTAILSTPRTEGPPQLPPLSFQQRTAPQERLAPLGAEDSARHPISNRSFSAVEEQVAHRGHFRNATFAETGYTADPSTGIGLGIAQPHPRHPQRGMPLDVLRQASVGDVPRVFTGSFSELESDMFDLKLHKVKTPEDQPGSPLVPSSPGDGPVVRDFADATRTPSMCPSPVTLLQRREALVSRDVQWESREVNGEMVRSRRPSEKIQRSLTIDDPSGGLQAWLSQHSPVEQSLPETPGSAIRRGSMRQRDNTL
ncbi:hypothetical protein LTR36_010775 [Oleoguttula mirabilis]|uniref:Uncharacterized protein n=1 Tax=Oleoguttula mirabilis TaxID=1507867 RepID=A0AAV9JU04_9PEZI|nr:hypothetical protein LTR36_010775 [Oleoguttula mirabilis]